MVELECSATSNPRCMYVLLALLFLFFLRSFALVWVASQSLIFLAASPHPWATVRLLCAPCVSLEE